MSNNPRISNITINCVISAYAAVSVALYADSTAFQNYDYSKIPTLHEVESNHATSFVEGFREQEVNQELTLLNTIHRVNSFANLEKNWNGYGAQTPSSALIKKTIIVLNSLKPYTQNFEAFPTGRNSIQLEMARKDTYLEIEIFESNYAFYLESEGNELEEEFESLEDLVTYFSLKHA